MSPLFAYAVKSLSKNRTRTIVTIIGVMMSAALLTALAVFGTSLYHYMEEGYAYEDGDWHIGIVNGPLRDVEKAAAEIEMLNPVTAKSIGYAYAKPDGGLSYPDGGLPYLYLQGVTSSYYEHMPVHVTEGRLPEREGEILLPESFRSDMAKLQTAADLYQTGSAITLGVGLRLQEDTALWQYVPYGAHTDGYGIITESDTPAETLRHLQSQTYTIAGFYQDDSTGSTWNNVPGYPAFVRWDGEMTEDGYDRYSLWFQIPDVGNNKFHQIYDTLRLTYGYEGSRLPVNLELLSLYGVRISEKGESTAIAAVVIILLVIILVGSVMLIYNAFAISVGERTRQFGLFSSIGATKKQILQSVLWEAAIISLFGALLGVFAGVGLVAAALRVGGEIVADLLEFSLRPGLYIWFPAILAAMVLAIVTVLVSAWIPAKRATRITAIEAIRQTRDIRYSDKQGKVPAFVERLFGYEGTLAMIYSGRNRKRYRIITIALFLSMVLFISINAFSDYLMTVMEVEYKTTNYEVLVQFPSMDSLSADEAAYEKEQQTILELLRGMKSVDGATRVSFLDFRMPFAENEAHLTKQFKKVLEDKEQKSIPSLAVSVVDDESFSAFCREHGLDESRFLDAENLTVIVNNHFKTVDPETSNTRLTDGLSEKDGTFYADLARNSSIEGYQPKITKFTAGYYAESLAPGCNDNWNLTVMLPERLAKQLDLHTTGNSSYCLLTSDHRTTAEEAEALFKTEYPDCVIYDQAERQAGNRNLVFLLRLLSNGFIIMITIISMSNVFSTISSSLKLRQKEFAMLKTVGMTQKGLQRMMNLECVLYGGKAVIFGLPVSVLISAILYYYFRQDVIFSFYLPVQSILIAVGSVFGVVFVTMLYTMGRMKKENVIDVLKQESF